MTVRVFDYQDFTAGSRIILDEGTLDTFRSGGFLTGAWTAVAAFNRTGATTDSTQFIFSASNSGAMRFGLSFTNAGAMQLTVGGITRTFTGLNTSAGTWYVCAFRKTAGTATPSAKLWNGDTGAVVADWTNGSGTLDDDSNLWDQLQIGNRVNDFPINGKIAAVALYSSALDDTTGNTLGTGLQEWLDASPVAMWILNQASTATPVLDEIGDADQTSIVGTSVDTGDDPTSFDLTLGGGASQVALTPARLQLRASVLGRIRSLTPARLQVRAVALTAAPGVVSVALTPARLQLRASALTVTLVPIEVALTPARLQFRATPLVADPGPVSVSLSPATLRLRAMPLGTGAGAIAVELSPATLRMRAVPLSATPRPVPVALAPATLRLRAGILSATPGPVAVALVPARLRLRASVLSVISLRIVALTPARLRLRAVPLGVASQFEPFHPPAIIVDVTPVPIAFDLSDGTARAEVAAPPITVDVTLELG